MSPIHYVTGLDGWGHICGDDNGKGEPSADDQATFCALVVHRLTELHPGHAVTAEVDPRALTSKVTSDDPEIDCAELCSYVGNEIWSDWCSGRRAPESEVDSDAQCPEHGCARWRCAAEHDGGGQ